MNASMVPSDLLAGTALKWTRDDVYQIGQLLGMLVRATRAASVGGSASRRRPDLKEIVSAASASGGKLRARTR
jgi:hypothetical protein